MNQQIIKNTLTLLKRRILQAIVYSLIIASSIGLLTTEPSIAAEIESIKDVTPEIINDSPAIPTPVEQANFVTSVTKTVEPAVVQINVSRSLDGVFLRPFFGRPPANSARPMLRGVGSGFVIDADGLVLTNAHVVERADNVTVTFQDGRILDGKVLGKDPVTDVAVIKVNSDNLPAVTIGDSDRVEQGQWAIAIGNPLGLQETVTVGVISATHRFSRDIGIPDKRIGFIQTDAAINPGNSGGPLLNARGEVIAVNSAIIGGAQGLGFAIPINTAQKVALQLIATGKVEHPYIGVEMVSLTPQVKQKFNQIPNRKQGIKSDRGILIMAIDRNSPAANAGLQVGDVIQAVNNQSVTTAETLQKLLDENGINRRMQLEVDRNSESIDVTVKPQSLPV
ncbi:trypsin-like peptidase domain-containing protein [Pleurocapsales cyanobacterium LEGE 10410]|nr:trypsin-like peptidase domain-containing protein [Pleurocapsales cyanobacterium LEGE 10410]